MSQPSVIYWPPSVGHYVAALHPVVQIGETLTLNSNGPGSHGPFKYKNMVRSITITSPDNINTAVFTVSGIGAAVGVDGNPTSVLRPITEEITGVNGGGVPSTHIYSQINSIENSVALATNVSVTYGSFGITSYVFTDYNRQISQISVSGQVISGAGLQYTVYKSFNKPESSNIIGYTQMYDAPAGDLVDLSSSLEPFGLQVIPGSATPDPTQIAFIPAFQVQAAGGVNTFNFIEGPTAVVWSRVTATTTGSLYFTVLQQGIN